MKGHNSNLFLSSSLRSSCMMHLLALRTEHYDLRFCSHLRLCFIPSVYASFCVCIFASRAQFRMLIRGLPQSSEHLRENTTLRRIQQEFILSLQSLFFPAFIIESCSDAFTVHRRPSVQSKLNLLLWIVDMLINKTYIHTHSYLVMIKQIMIEVR